MTNRRILNSDELKYTCDNKQSFSHKMCKLKFMVIFTLLILSPMVSALKQNEYVNYRFRCIDELNNYCSDGIQLLISIEGPGGNNLVDNSSMTYNPTYFNHTLPTGSAGEYKVIIISPTVNGTISEFKYEVTPSGFSNISNFFYIIIIIIVLLSFLGLYLRNNWIMMLVSILVLIFGFFIIRNGVDIFKDTQTTWAVGLVIWAVGIYGLYLSAEGQLKEGGQ